GWSVTSSKRLRTLPDLPTPLEAGFADSDYPILFGMFVPAKTPRDVIDKLHRETSKVLQAPKVQERFAAPGMELMLMSPAEFDAHVKKEISLNAELVKALGLKPN